MAKMLLSRRAILWTGYGASAGLRFVIVVLLSHLAGKTVMGAYLAITAITSIFVRLLDFGLPSAIVYYCRSNPGNAFPALKLSLWHTLAMTIPIVAITLGMGIFPFAGSDVNVIVREAAPAIVALMTFQLANALLSNIFLAADRSLSFVVMLVGPLIVLCCGVVVLRVLGPVTDDRLLLTVAVSELVPVLFGITIGGVCLRGSRKKILWRRLYKYGGATMPGTAAKAIAQRIDRVILAALVPLEAISLYSVGTTFREALMVPFNAYSIGYLARLIDAEKADRGNGARRSVAGNALVWSLLLCVAAALGIVLMPYVTPLVFGKSFVLGVPAAQITIISPIFLCVSALLFSYFLAIGKPLVTSSLSIFSTVVSSALLLICAQRWDIVGAAGGSLIASGLTVIACLGKMMLERRDLTVPALGARYMLETATPGLSTQQQRARETIEGRDNPADWENALCLCGAAGGKVISTKDRHGLPYRKLICSQCGLLRVSPRWKAERYSEFYRNEYRDLYTPSDKPKIDFFHQIAASGPVAEIDAWVIAATARHRGLVPQRIVEIGTGGGWNLVNLPQSWTRIGYDVEREYLDIGRGAGLTMKEGFLDQAIATGDVAAADVILLSHVVEHFLNPVLELEKLRQAMRQDALLLIEVPGIFRVHAKSRDPMRLMQNAHTFTFSAETLKGACRTAGFSVLEAGEDVRVTCRPTLAATAPRATKSDLPKRILRYLLACEWGCRISRALRRVPFAGRYIAAAFRSVWFPVVGFTFGPRIMQDS